ncbi:hypothetical protein Bbelb_008310 [Branchiostoma belcheri]|nr:hypothetical protein Bbelb_008310 [Branchiostoma belcheri]
MWPDLGDPSGKPAAIVHVIDPDDRYHRSYGGTPPLTRSTLFSVWRIWAKQGPETSDDIRVELAVKSAGCHCERCRYFRRPPDDADKVTTGSVLPLTTMDYPGLDPEDIFFVRTGVLKTGLSAEFPSGGAAAEYALL